VSILLPVFEDYLTSAPDTASNDAVRQSIVILMGCLAKHLDKDNPRIKPIVAQLIGALSTPSQEVMYTWLITAELIFFEKTIVQILKHTNFKQICFCINKYIMICFLDEIFHSGFIEFSYFISIFRSCKSRLMLLFFGFYKF
jgi:hypothetical protein